MAIIIQGSRVAGVGKPGLSAYDLAKKGGYTGTEAEFSRELNAATSFDDYLESHNLNAEAHPDLQALIDAIVVPTTAGDVGAYSKAETDNLVNQKQDKITGTAGDFVVIGSDGNVTTKTIAYAEGDEF